MPTVRGRDRYSISPVDGTPSWVCIAVTLGTTGLPIFNGCSVKLQQLFNRAPYETNVPCLDAKPVMRQDARHSDPREIDTRRVRVSDGADASQGLTGHQPAACAVRERNSINIYTDQLPSRA